MDSEVDTVSLWKITVIETIEIPQDWNAKLILYRAIWTIPENVKWDETYLHVCIFTGF